MSAKPNIFLVNKQTISFKGSTFTNATCTPADSVVYLDIYYACVPGKWTNREHRACTWAQCVIILHKYSYTEHIALHKHSCTERILLLTEYVSEPVAFTARAGKTPRTQPTTAFNSPWQWSTLAATTTTRRQPSSATMTASTCSSQHCWRKILTLMDASCASQHRWWAFTLSASQNRCRT